MELKQARGEKDDAIRQKLTKEELAQLNAKFDGLTLISSGQVAVDLTHK